MSKSFFIKKIISLILTIQTEYPNVTLDMKTPIPIAPQNAIFFTENPDESPVIQLQDTSEAITWLDNIKMALKREKANNSFKYSPPESPVFTEVLSLEILIKKLESREPFILWDVCREVYPDGKSNGAFESMCTKLFG